MIGANQAPAVTTTSPTAVVGATSFFHVAERASLVIRPRYPLFLERTRGLETSLATPTQRNQGPGARRATSPTLSNECQKTEVRGLEVRERKAFRVRLLADELFVFTSLVPAWSSQRVASQMRLT